MARVELPRGMDDTPNKYEGATRLVGLLDWPGRCVGKLYWFLVDSGKLDTCLFGLCIGICTHEWRL